MQESAVCELLLHAISAHDDEVISLCGRNDRFYTSISMTIIIIIIIISIVARREEKRKKESVSRLIGYRTVLGVGMI